jgi:hypothetical protein
VRLVNFFHLIAVNHATLRVDCRICRISSNSSDQDEPIVVVVEVHVEPKEAGKDEATVDLPMRRRPSVVTLADVDDILVFELE